VTATTNGKDSWAVSVHMADHSQIDLQAEMAFFSNTSSSSEQCSARTAPLLCDCGKRPNPGTGMCWDCASCGSCLNCPTCVKCAQGFTKDAQGTPYPYSQPQRPSNLPQSSALTKASIDGWLAAVETPDVSPGSLLSNYTTLRTYYSAWWQFWYNTEHAQGHWLHDIVTPSLSTYGRGIWIWDTGFHVLALLHGGGAGLTLAKEQIQVMCEAGRVIGHIPRVVVSRLQV
jgi:hypothetical protein